MDDLLQEVRQGVRMIAKNPGFTLVAGDLSEKTLADFAGTNVILNIVPSFETGTCAISVKTFNTDILEHLTETT